jgi:Mg2+ and Co2+ transporter CorA
VGFATRKMQVFWVSGGTIEERDAADLETLLRRDDGFVWVDIPECGDKATRVLGETFGFHPMALRDCKERSHVPKLRAYPDHMFAILHAPEPDDEGGRVHLIELDQFVGVRYIVTVHGPLGEGVPPEVALRESRAVRRRIEDGRLRVSSPSELSHALVSALAGRQESFVAAVATKVAALERRVLKGDMKDPEASLEEMFRLRHELLTVRTMAAQSRELVARMVAMAQFLPAETHALTQDLADRFERTRSICDGEREYLQGVLDFYQSRTATKMNIAMERLALLAAVMMPVSAVAGIYGMNVIVNRQTDFRHTAGVLGFMALVALGMLRWAKRHGWW